MNNINRIAIFFFYDKDGIVDDYVSYLLEDINKNISELLIVCNGKLTQEGRKKFSKFTNNILVRENVGFDVWAYKEGMECYGWEKLRSFDEVILMNFTIFGPLYPFKEMFTEMESRDVDFWGITAAHKVNYDPFGNIKYGYIPKHIQSHFIAIRKSMLCSMEFKKYWTNIPPINSYSDAIGLHEAIFTKEFEDKGFKYSIYVDTDDLADATHCPILSHPLEMIRDKKCPIFKRRSFFHNYEDTYHNTTGQPTVEVYEYIKEHFDYDMNMVLDNILRLQNMADIKRQLHLNYILPSKYLIAESSNTTKKVALIIHIYFKDLIPYCLRYAKSMPRYADIIITTDKEDKKADIIEAFKDIDCNNVKVILIENRGRDVSALLVACKDFIMDYDYVCFAHDKKTLQVYPHSIGESFSYKCFENVLGSKAYVENIIQTFDQDERLGLLTPSPPNHGDFYPTLSTMSWGPNYEITVELAKRLGLHVDISRDKDAIAPLGTMFWFRTSAMKRLFDEDWEYKDFPTEPNKNDGTLLHAVERIYPFVVQDAGYLVGHVYSDRFARIEITNLEYIAKQLNEVLFGAFGSNSLYGLTNIIKYRVNDNMESGRNIGWLGLFKEDMKFRLRNRKILYRLVKINYRALRKIYRRLKRR